MNKNFFDNLPLLITLVKFFKIIGLAPFKLTILPSQKNQLNGYQLLGHTSYSIMGSIYNLALPLTSIPTLYYWLPEVRHKTWSSDTAVKMDGWREFFFGISSHGTYVIIVFFCVVRQRMFIKVINRLFRFEKELGDVLYNTKDLPTGKSLLVFVFFTHLSITVFNTTTEFFAEPEHTTTIDTIIFIIPEFIIGNFVIQYALILIFLKSRFSGLNKLLLSLVDTNYDEPKCQRFFRVTTDSCNENVIKLIRYIRNAQRNLYEISDDFSNCYSWPMLTSITYFAAGIIYSSYEFYESIKNPDTKILLAFNLALWLVKTMIPIITLTCSVTKIIDEIEETSDTLYKILTIHAKDKGIRYELEQFSIELLHRDASITACGTVPLDNSLLTSIVQTTITYMIIILQYHKKNTSPSTMMEHSNGTSTTESANETDIYSLMTNATI